MSDTRAQDEVAIQAVLVDSYRAWEAGDADGMVANYTADATAVLPGSLREDREVIREDMALAFAGPLQGSSTYNKQLSLRFLGRDAAIVISESGILFAGESEVPDERKVNATWAYDSPHHQDLETVRRRTVQQRVTGLLYAPSISSEDSRDPWSARPLPIITAPEVQGPPASHHRGGPRTARAPREVSAAYAIGEGDTCRRV